MELIKELKRWGEFKDEDQYYIKQCNLSRYSPRTFLNVLFKPIDLAKYSVVEKVAKLKVRNDLLKFYTKYNGIMLFAQTFRIYGVGVEPLTSAYATQDIMVENAKIRAMHPKVDFSNVVVFGSSGSSKFFYKVNEKDKVYVADDKSEDFRVIHEFKNIEELLKYYIEKLSAYYNDLGYRKDKSEDELKSWLKNIVYDNL